MRHDARQHRAKLSSEAIRISLKMYTPAEKEARLKAAEQKRLEKAAEAAKGCPLFEEHL